VRQYISSGGEVNKFPQARRAATPDGPCPG